jgi:hypothetical protein
MSTIFDLLEKPDSSKLEPSCRVYAFCLDLDLEELEYYILYEEFSKRVTELALIGWVCTDNFSWFNSLLSR